MKELKIITLDGKQVKYENQHINSINVEDLNPGVYFVIVKTQESTSTQKFIKQ
jgi:mevalonate kinase